MRVHPLVWPNLARRGEPTVHHGPVACMEIWVFTGVSVKPSVRIPTASLRVDVTGALYRCMLERVSEHRVLYSDLRVPVFLPTRKSSLRG